MVDRLVALESTWLQPGIHLEIHMHNVYAQYTRAHKRDPIRIKCENMQCNDNERM